MKLISKEDIKEYWQSFRRYRQRRRVEKAEKRRNSPFWQKMEKVFAWMNKFSHLMHAGWACVLYFIMEALSRHSVAKAWE